MSTDPSVIWLAATTPEQAVLVRQELQAICASPAFMGSKRCQHFLQLIVEHALEGRFDALRERMIGAEMFGRPVGYDTANDAVVRVKATEVRKRLAQYYRECPDEPIVQIEIPPGSYDPKFHWRTTATSVAAENESLDKQSLTESAANGDAALAPPAPEQLGAGAKTGPVDLTSFTLTSLWRRGIAVAIIAIMAMLLGVGAYYFLSQWGYPSSKAVPKIKSIAVLPIKNLSGDPRQDYLADGMTEQLIADLGQISALRVISSTSSRAYKNTSKRLPVIGAELGVDAVVEGSMTREGEHLKLTVQLEDAKKDSQIWTQTYKRDPTSMIDVEGELAGDIADKIRIEVIPRVQRRLVRLHSIQMPARDAYLRGKAALNDGDPRKAVEYFEEAVRIEPNYAEAHSGMASAYGWLGESAKLPYEQAFRRQLSEAVLAVQIDDDLADGHAEIADAALSLTWDWAVAEEELQRALELNPSSVEVHRSYAMFLYRVGRAQQAVSEARTQQVLNPVSSYTLDNVAYVYYCARQYDEALAVLEKRKKLAPTPDPDIDISNFILGAILTEKGQYEQGIEAFEKIGDSVHVLGHLGNAYARAGQVAAARSTIPKLEEHVKQDGLGRYEIALVYAGLGEKDEAFAWLEKAYEAHDKGITFLKIDPCVEPLRSDPRFQDLVRRVGFPL